MEKIKLNNSLLRFLFSIFGSLPAMNVKIDSNADQVKLDAENIVDGKSRPRIYVDSASFEPQKMQKNGFAVVIVARNAENIICECIRRQRRRAAVVVVFDKDSNDATPFLAAEEGAVVVCWSKDVSVEEALCEAILVAHHFSENVAVVRLEAVCSNSPS